MNTSELKIKRGNRPVYFKGLDLADFNIDLTKREVTMAWNAFAVKDNDNDIILKGAFAKSIAERGPASATSRKIAYLKYHNWHLPVGPLTELKEDDKYLVAKAKIDPTPEGDDTVTQYQTGTLNQHSIGYRYVWDKGEYSEADDAFVWKEINLFEGSVVVAGVNENTPLLEIHGEFSADLLAKAMDELEGFLRGVEIKNQYDIRRTVSKIIALTESNEPNRESLKGEGEPHGICSLNFERLATAFINQNN